MQVRRSVLVSAAVASMVTVAACGGGGGGGGNGEPSGGEGPASLQVLIASSGDAETNAVRTAAAAWAEETGNSVTVNPARDINQELGQGFAGGSPPDVFYIDGARFGDYARQGSLYAYGDQIEDTDDFYPNLLATFTFDGELYCLPKDFSTLALIINTEAWEAAGLGDGDVPTTWEDLQTVAGTLTEGRQVGLVVGDTIDRLGAFMVQNGGWLVNEDGTEVTADTPENVQALQFVSDMLSEGTAAYPAQVDAGWGGEAFGLGAGAMTIEGNWIKGALENDFPDRQFIAVELPEGPVGKGTLSFTQCYGIAQQSQNQAAAVELVKFLTSQEQQLEATRAFGVMPSRISATDGYLEEFPDDAAFVAGGEYGQGPVNVPGFTNVMAELNNGISQMPRTTPEQILSTFQTNAEAALG
jgi:multiple sugar transport system substrate-binding protein